MIAVPLSIGLALFLTELAPRWLAAPIGLATELLAAIPSVVYGVRAVFVLVPFLRERVEAPVSERIATPIRSPCPSVNPSWTNPSGRPCGRPQEHGYPVMSVLGTGHWAPGTFAPHPRPRLAQGSSCFHVRSCGE